MVQAWHFLGSTTLQRLGKLTLREDAWRLPATAVSTGKSNGSQKGSNGQFADHEAITVDPTNGTIYVTWAQFDDWLARLEASERELVARCAFERCSAQLLHRLEHVLKRFRCRQHFPIVLVVAQVVAAARSGGVSFALRVAGRDGRAAAWSGTRLRRANVAPPGIRADASPARISSSPVTRTAAPITTPSARVGWHSRRGEPRCD